MKKIILFALLFSASNMVFGQKALRNKRFTKGFNVGFNHANFLMESSNPLETINNGTGFRLGLISNLAISKRFSLEPQAELSFNSSQLIYGEEQRTINPVDLEFMIHAKLKLRKGGLSPYLIAGPNVKFPLGDKNSLVVPTREHVGIDMGIGLDVPFGRRVLVSPELRYSFGLTSINENSTYSDIKFHNVALILNLSGRPRF
ncbi:MAG: PorT family protein [Crocinitomicaceae bacterium]|nr:PorT family protein [Crocinitomicaceae bacterium]